ncbi:DUF4190 domain-containing protein [Janibacter terrae]|uniref:DUF4190 domain-containing protein n=1 Tax=Janibacter terrae TaxID=103817 RepID=A0ABZ2FDK9_9MICO|nr:DUF4190 domain-containing protein [Janibacter terrae]MBA4083579.1 DUF4190 domain-containing protein [Kytococcus sp.]HBO53650.1 DUF4190 domain-containing protein [Janibacter terrae]HCE61322.1 DUF4190 domain-containing protein [Janibacter terrae]
MTTPPPPPGSGGNQPYDPTGSNPYPSSEGSGSTPSGSTPAGSFPGATPPPPPGAPSYGSPSGGMPPQAPPPGGGFPQQGQSNNGKIMSIISIVTGVIGLCCCSWFVFSIAAVVLGYLGGKEFDKTGEKKTLAQVGLGLGVLGIVLGIIVWILTATGVIDANFYSDLS